MSGLDEERRGARLGFPPEAQALFASRQRRGSRLGSVRRERLTLTKFRQQMLAGHGERRSAVEHDCYGEQAIARFQLANP